MDEREWLEAYQRRARDYPRPSVTVDLVIVSVIDADAKVLLVRRREPPFEGHWALPGGFVRVGDAMADQGEGLEEAAHRELAEETGLAVGSCFLEQLGAFGRPGRDPRMRVISVAFFALVRPTLVPLVVAGSDAADARWFSLTELPELAFDHREILEGAIVRIRERLERSSIAFELVPEQFTIGELRGVYSAVLGEPQDAGNFRRRFRRLEADGVIEKAPGMRLTATRPAAVYRFRRH